MFLTQYLRICSQIEQPLYMILQDKKEQYLLYNRHKKRNILLKCCIKRVNWFVFKNGVLTKNSSPIIMELYNGNT